MIGLHKTEIRSCVIVVCNGFDRAFENVDFFQVFLFAYSKVLEHINKGIALNDRFSSFQNLCYLRLGEKYSYLYFCYL